MERTRVMCSRGTFSPLEPYLRGGGEARKKLARRDRRSRWRRREGEEGGREGRKEGRWTLVVRSRVPRALIDSLGRGEGQGGRRGRRRENEKRSAGLYAALADSAETHAANATLILIIIPCEGRAACRVSCATFFRAKNVRARRLGLSRSRGLESEPSSIFRILAIAATRGSKWPGLRLIITVYQRTEREGEERRREILQPTRVFLATTRSIKIGKKGKREARGSGCIIGRLETGFADIISRI